MKNAILFFMTAPFFTPFYQLNNHSIRKKLGRTPLHFFTERWYYLHMANETEEINKRAQRNVLILMEWYDHAFRKGIGRFAGGHGWHLTVPAERMVPVGWRGDGVMALIGGDRRIVTFVRRAKCPVVDLGAFRPDIRLPRVVGDHEQIGRLGAEHFLDRQYVNLAFFAIEASPVQALRLKGFRDVCNRVGHLRPEVWIRARKGGPADDWPMTNRWLRRCLANAPKPLGVFAYNDEAASWVEDACRDAGFRVPEDVAILGVDDNPLICLNQPVPLSSIAHNRERVGYEGATLLERLMDASSQASVDGQPSKYKSSAVPSPILIPPLGVVLRQSSDVTAAQDPRVRTALQVIRKWSGRAFGAEEVAAEVGVSRATLDRLFRENIGRSVHEEADRLRFDAAKDLLLHSSESLADVAEQVGLCNASYLTRLFRKREGMTPSVFRGRQV
jgi:LacI family transcriptional regulator